MLSPFANAAHAREEDVAIDVEDYSNADRTTAPSPREPGAAAKAALRNRAVSMRGVVGTTSQDAGNAGTAIDAAQLKTVKKLGEGAFAIVEQCKYSAAAGDGSTRMVAVKKLKPGIVSQKEDLKAFLAEISLMQKLKHPCIVEYIGYGSTDTSSISASNSSMFLVSELMEGGTLKRLVMQQMKDPHRNLYSHQDALRWGIQIAEALAYLHNCTPMVIHRDLKLENILLKGTERSQQVAKLSDFGLVAILKGRSSQLLRDKSNTLNTPDKEQPSRSSDLSNSAAADEERWTRNSRKYITRMSSVGRGRPSIRMVSMGLQQQGAGLPPISKEALHQLSGRTGTYMYMAPEMYLSKDYNEKVDVFSFAVILYELLHKYMMVFAVSVQGTEEEIEQYAERVANGWRCPLNERFPKPLLDVIRDAWNQEPRSRPSMNEILRRLRQIEADGLLSSVKEQNACCCTIS